MRPYDPDSRHASQASEGPATTADVPTAADTDARTPTGPGAAGAELGEGRLRVLEEIGGGAMGQVFRAFDEALGIEVAVYNVGTHDGRPCYTMRLLRGGTLAAHRQRYQADPRAAVALLEKVCRGVAAAHAEGIVHRDLKPGNVLLDEQGEPLVADFGLAKLSDGLEVTQSGLMLGTLPYASPEQAASQAHLVTPASDVWALGVMLYELLTGRRPFVGAATEVALAILSGRYTPPEEARPGLPPALAAVVRRCLEQRPERRYPTAAELADDLARWLRGEAAATGPGLWRQAAALLRRPQVLLGGLALALLLPLLARAPLPERARPEAGQAAPAPVDLLDTRGPAPRFVVGEGHLTRPESGGLRVEATGLALVELLPRPPWGRFRLRVTVRDLGERTARVGVYFAATGEESPAGREHLFLGLGFSERPRLPQGQRTCLAELTLNRYRPRGRQDAGLAHSEAGGQQRFVPARGAPRRLWLEVTPATVRARWGDERDPFAQLFRDPWLNDTAAVLAAQPPALNRAGPLFPARGALGLICDGGPALFEDVVLEPLRQDD
jgi:hypothetical protein